jgi:diguanylate cyclase (GGDEF)-like protein
MSSVRRQAETKRLRQRGSSESIGAKRIMSIFRHAPSLSVGLRVLAIALIPLGGFAANLYNYVLSEQQVAIAVADFERSAALSHASHDLSESLIVMRSVARDFSAAPSQTLASDYLAAHAAALRSIEKIEAAGDPEDRRDIAQLRSQLNVVLDQWARIKRAVGVSDTEGVRGEIAGTGAAVDRIINQGISWLPDSVAKELTFSLLKMRYDEADYAIKRLSYTKDLIFQTFEQVSNAVAVSAGTESQKNQVLQVLKDYIEAFRKWSLAIETLRPLLAVNSADTELMLPVVAHVMTLAEAKASTASAALSDSQARTRMAILSVGFAVAGIGLVLSWIIGRGLTRPLTALAGAMKKLAAGQFDVALPGLGRTDEIGSVANAVETFKIKAIERAQTDVLTGLANRRMFLDRVCVAFADARRNGTPFVVHSLDLDQFKDVNDTMGHPAGDWLLCQVADRLKACVRETDLVARFGGDEFAVLQTGANDPATDAGALAAKIGAVLAAPYEIEGATVNVTVSIGIARYQPELTSPEAIMIQADLALYRAKEDGRKCYCFHSPELDRQVRERVAITDDLRGAIGRSELELYYQPQVELATGHVLGLEALLRWKHPTRGLVSPTQFIPIAERSGSIIEIGKWVFEEACRQYHVWRTDGVAPNLLAVNFSATQFKAGADLEHDIAACLKRWAIAPECIEIELTESVLMHVSEQHGDILERMRRSGLHIALDDFGTGYSSLSYLTTYPVNRLKIAQQLVFGVTTERRSATVVRAAIRLARDLNIDLIAEGVENADQAKFLLSAGCRQAQGYHFGRPMDAASATEFLRQRFSTRVTEIRPMRIAT